MYPHRRVREGWRILCSLFLSRIRTLVVSCTLIVRLFFLFVSCIWVLHLLSPVISCTCVVLLSSPVVSCTCVAFSFTKRFSFVTQTWWKTSCEIHLRDKKYASSSDSTLQSSYVRISLEESNPACRRGRRDAQGLAGHGGADMSMHLIVCG